MCPFCEGQRHERTHVNLKSRELLQRLTILESTETVIGSDFT